MTTQISPEDLNARLADPAVKVVDGSWALDGTDMHALYLQDHIPGAVFFDLDAISDHSTPLPHMAPSAAQFAEAVRALGISDRDHVIVYDRQGLFSAARVWWTFRLMGHDNVQVLCGGLPAWKSAGLPVESGDVASIATIYTPRLQTDKIVTMAQIIESPVVYRILDARSRARFEGTAPEPRAGLRSGHIPGSQSLPFADLIRDGALKPYDELASIFSELGITAASPVVTSCGSGVTAAIVSMALHEVGHTQALLYDGSWAEWGQDTLHTPVVIGAA